ncbi:hypothetical protein J2X32_002696 [Rheinheimera pacifica]|uniref:glycosyltransferase family 29 protein n=1 Tax=Rheinheimera pacifica TaxID=173990 RepID=UPI0028599BC7|nr:glycosyltransferase family 29 protein [Rheinheimera pacifica]MDR6984054.1 hypothetical protein [Rheinheimera pacifica]
MSTDIFLQRANYRGFTTAALRRYAKTQSSLGIYNVATLWAFRTVWLSSQTGRDYLAYLVFRRALGYSLSQRKAEILQHFLHLPILLRYWHGLYGHRQRQSLNLLAEYNYISQAVSSEKIAVLKPFQQTIQHLRQHQFHWQQSFSLWLQGLTRVQMVGNSPKLQHSKLGSYIDAADVVIRFNNCFSQHSKAVDAGSQCHVWVMAPDYRGLPPDNTQWCLLSGPNMLWWQQNWPQWLNSAQAKVISIPLAHWRTLVRQLAAPPSAGLLVGHYVASQVDKQSVLQLAGFGYNPAQEQQYHYVAPEHKAVSRHNWQAEYQLLQQWQQTTAGALTND